MSRRWTVECLFGSFICHLHGRYTISKDFLWHQNTSAPGISAVIRRSRCSSCKTPPLRMTSDASTIRCIRVHSVSYNSVICINVVHHGVHISLSASVCCPFIQFLDWRWVSISILIFYISFHYSYFNSRQLPRSCKVFYWNFNIITHFKIYSSQKFHLNDQTVALLVYYSSQPVIQHLCS